MTILITSSMTNYTNFGKRAVIKEGKQFEVVRGKDDDDDY